MEALPLDARLLSNAVIELNIARHILTLYAKEHQLVQLSLDKSFAIFAELFELRNEITLAVAKDTLIVDGRQLDTRNPVNREFALALSRLSVAFVSFVKGLTREEVYGFFRFLSREASDLSSDTLPDILTEYELRHILIEPLDYRLFAFAENQTVKDGSDRHLLDRHLKALLDGDLPVEGVRSVVDSVDPAALAVLLNQTGDEIARPSTYDTVVSSYLRADAGEQFSGANLQRLMTFVGGLRPELKQQFLASSIKSVTRDAGVLGRALEEVSVDSIIDFFGGFDGARAVLSEPLSALIAQFARTGVELPGGSLNLDDVLVSRESVNLFKDGSGEHTPAEYRAEMRRLLDEAQREPSLPPGSGIERELEEEYVRYCYANALLELLESQVPQLVALEDEDSYTRSFGDLAARAIASGQYMQLLELLTRFDDLEARDRHSPVIRAVRETFDDPGFLASIAESIRWRGRGNRSGAAAVCSHYGARIAPALFDVLALEERSHVRRMLLLLLAGLGQQAVDEIALRFHDERWHVRRNALYLIAETGVRVEPLLLAPLSADPDPRVRLECARCLARAGDPAAAAILRELMREESGVTDVAVAAAGTLGMRELIPDLVAVARRSTGPSRSRSRLRVVRSLRQIGGDEAAAALRELLGLRSLYPGETRRFRAEVRKALQRLGAAPAPGSRRAASGPEGAP